MPDDIASFKQRVFNQYLHQITERITALQNQLAGLKEMVAAETKSTAGDKYETARAMIHIEQEQIGKQLAEAQLQQSALNKIDWRIQSTTIINSSLVSTDKGFFFMSVGLGKIVVDEKTVFALSQQSPLGAALIGQPVGSVVSINNNRYLITEIL